MRGNAWTKGGEPVIIDKVTMSEIRGRIRVETWVPHVWNRKGELDPGHPSVNDLDKPGFATVQR